MYKSLYKEIISNAKQQNRKKNDGVYFEAHHIVPEFMFKERARKGPSGHLDGNPNAKSNLVLLTFQEHLMAHYYLYEILKSTRYVHSAGSALQFFFVKAVGNHIRQKNLEDVDVDFLDKMAHLREIGVKSTSTARKGKFPAVDRITKESVGSVDRNHPKVLSGEWVHHSLGKPGKKHPDGFGKGATNYNYREMTPERRARVFECLAKSVDDADHFISKKFEKNLKEEFKEFKKISMVWIVNNFGSTRDMISTFNTENNRNVKYERYYRGKEQREQASKIASAFRWVSDGVENKKVRYDELSDFLSNNPAFQCGKRKL